MPFDSTPRMTPLARVSFLPGIYVPTAENTLFMPVRALGAPQTTCTGSPPASTMQTLSRSALGCCLASMTEATTKPSYLRAGSSTDSTSRPTRVSVSTISLSEAEVSRWSLSQERVNFIAIQQRGVRIRSPAQSPGERRDVERLEAIVIDPAQVRVEEVAQIRQAVFEHRQAIEADAPSEALIDLRVEAAIRKHIGMDHAAAEDFEPILALAEPDLPAGTAALDVDLERRRSERKEAWTEAHADMRHFEESLAEFLQHPLEVGERRALIDHQAFDLMEHRRMRLVGIAPIGAAGADDPDRRLLGEHRAHLHRARVGAQNLPFALVIRLEEERVVHLERRMAGREVELGEIVVVAFDVRPLGDGEAHLSENGGDLVHHLADRMDAPSLGAGQRDGQGDVERLALELRLEGRALEHRAPRRQRLRDLILQRVDGCALRLALVRRKLTKRREQCGNRSFLAERGDARRLERVFIRRAFNLGQRLPFKGGKVRHSSRTPGEAAAFSVSTGGGSRALAQFSPGSLIRPEPVLPDAL